MVKMNRNGTGMFAACLGITSLICAWTILPSTPAADPIPTSVRQNAGQVGDPPRRARPASLPTAAGMATATDKRGDDAGPDSEAVRQQLDAMDPVILERAAKLGMTDDVRLLARATRLKQIIDASPNKGAPPVFCYDQGTSNEDMSRVWELVPELSPNQPRYQLSDSNRWGGASQQGQPITLSWSLVPDGLLVDGGVSELFANLDAKFGNRALWISRIEESFARWAALTGTEYVRRTAPGVDWDDGAAWLSSPGSATRGDVRIASIVIDGGSGILAYNYFPETGDMVLDASESWAVFSTNNHRFFRNVLMHEHGHGLGLGHICPISQFWLMEPFLNTGFDGPQHDDIRGIHRGYGDAFENNDMAAAATNVGTVFFGSPIVIGAVPAPNVFNGATASIDGDGDQDWYRFTVVADSTASVTVTPIGMLYDNSPQNCPEENGSCCFFNVIDTRIAADLAVSIIDSNGSTVLATADSELAGDPESLSDVLLPSGPGDYYIKVFKTDFGNTSQLYRINLSVITVGADIAPPQPNPLGFEAAPFPLGTTSIKMIAAEASDATPPIEYQFDFVSGGTGGGPDSLWQMSREFTDVGLLANRNYTYRIRTRDSAPHPGPNVSADSPTSTGTTHIETPAGVIIGTVTENSVDLSLAIPLPSFYVVEQSGIFFDSVTAGGDGGINEWIQVTADTAVSLTPNTQYEFRAKARNRRAIETETWSPSASAVTLAAAPNAPVLANPSSVSLKVNPDAGANPPHTEMTIRCVGTSPFDANWDGMYVDAASQPSAAAVWQSDTAWGNKTVGGLQPSTQYTFVVRARNLNSIETLDGPAAALTTQPPGYCNLLGDIDANLTRDSLDIAGFVRTKLGIPDGGDQVNCADYGNFDLLLDTEDFVEDLLAE